jgi:hypothetical protein
MQRSFVWIHSKVSASLKVFLLCCIVLNTAWMFACREKMTELIWYVFVFVGITLPTGISTKLSVKQGALLL